LKTLRSVDAKVDETDQSKSSTSSENDGKNAFSRASLLSSITNGNDQRNKKYEFDIPDIG